MWQFLEVISYGNAQLGMVNALIYFLLLYYITEGEENCFKNTNATERERKMNRVQRRKLEKEQRKNFSKRHIDPVAEQPDFSDVPLATLCQSIQLLINELYGRGYPVYDFDNKDRFVQGIQIIQGKIFFLVAGEEAEHEKV